jgi:hypothetical protein
LASVLRLLCRGDQGYGEPGDAAILAATLQQPGIEVHTLTVIWSESVDSGAKVRAWVLRQAALAGIGMRLPPRAQPMARQAAAAGERT